MSFKVVKITVGKGKTTGDEKAAKWQKEYFELEAMVEDESAIELAKGSLETLIDVWLKGETIAQERLEKLAPQEVRQGQTTYDAEKIKYTEATGTKGPYQKAVDEAQLADFAALVEDLKTHKGKLQRKGFFYWLFDTTPVAVGRKPSTKK